MLLRTAFHNLYVPFGCRVHLYEARMSYVNESGRGGNVTPDAILYSRTVLAL